MNRFILFLKGFAMGAVELVPGVSSGTIAFVVGIYTQLLDAIKSINLQSIRVLFKDGFGAFWKAIQGEFLLTLVLGMLCAILLLARMIQYAVHNHPEYCWSFFFGLILMASWHVSREVTKWSAWRSLLLVLGLSFAAWISAATPMEVQLTPFTLVLAGAIAISAMLMPGISGSFMLVLMGMYAPILVALNTFDWATIGLFVCGIVLGLLTFTRLLSWLLHHYEQAVLALMTGVMLGSLVKIWPWKETIAWRVNNAGENVPVLQSNVLPLVDAQLLYALLFMIMGMAVVLVIDQIAHKADQ